MLTSLEMDNNEFFLKHELEREREGREIWVPTILLGGGSHGDGVGEGMAVASRQRCRRRAWRRGGGGASRRCQCPLSSGLGFVGGIVAAAMNLMLRAPAPPLLYGAARRRPTDHHSVMRPRSGRGIKAQLGRWTESEEINLTFYPLISTYDLNLKYLLSVFRVNTNE